MLADDQLVDAGPAAAARAPVPRRRSRRRRSRRPGPRASAPARRAAHRVIAISSSQTASRSVESDARQVNGRRSHRSSSSAPAPTASSSFRPRPTQVRARSTGTTRSASPSRSRTTSRAAATSVGRRRVGVQAAFGQPHAADVGRVAGLHLVARRAPPRSSRRRGRRRRKELRRSPIRRPHRETTARPPRSPVITSATAPGTTAPSTSAVIAKNTSRLAASRVADVATIRTVRRRARCSSVGVVGQRGRGPRDRLRRELARGVDALAEPHDPHLAVHVAQPAVGRRRRSATESSWCRSRSRRPCSRHVHTSPIQDAGHRRLGGQHRQRLVAERIARPAPWPASARSARAGT